MSAKSGAYRAMLRGMKDWEAYLLCESGLPGPRGNIELAQAVAEEGTLALFEGYLEYDAGRAPVNSPYEFLAFCGAVGLGRCIAEGAVELLPVLRTLASDPRWRMREGVAMALQRLGDADMESLLGVARDWAQGTALEQRAAAAAICEPRLLKEARHARAALEILDGITASIQERGERRSAEFLALRKGMGYCWSVAAAALFEEGRPLMEKWMGSKDKDVQWILRENLKKNRLAQIDADWVKRWVSA